MTSISEKEFDELLKGLSRQAVHLETRDAYGTATELPYMAKWAAGEPDDLAWLNEWCDMLRQHVASGKKVRRARVVSLPLSDYQRWSCSIAYPMVEAGEDIRWVPRSEVSSIGVPGNDFYLIDDQLIIFLHYAGNGMATDRVVSTDASDIRLCREAFEAVWKLSTPHRDFTPV